MIINLDDYRTATEPDSSDDVLIYDLDRIDEVILNLKNELSNLLENYGEVTGEPIYSDLVYDKMFNNVIEFRKQK